MYLSIGSKVKYDITQTALGVDDMKSLIVSAIQSFNFNSLNGFNKTLRYSKLVAAIDSAQESVVSNDTDVEVTQFVSLDIAERKNYTVDFGMQLINDIGQKLGDHPSNQRAVVHTDTFLFQGEQCAIEDDGIGNLNIIKSTPDTHTVLTEIGKVNYETGILTINNFLPQDQKPMLKMTVRPREKDVTAKNRSILRVLDADINVRIEQVRI